MNDALTTRNPVWGFYGTMRSHSDVDAAWRLALDAIAEATNCETFAVRDFLDSRHGRHFADDVASGFASGLPLEAAIGAAVSRWLGWRIGRRMAGETGIPGGLPYLTGLVAMFEIDAEAPEEDKNPPPMIVG